VTPVLCLLLLAKAPIERHEPPLVRLAAGILQAGVWRASSARPGRCSSARRCVMLLAPSVLPMLGQSLVPGVQRTRLPDALDHQTRHFGRSRSAAS
jgi:hypothetical protein